MLIDLPHVLPLLAAFVYAVAALMIKRALEGGVGPWRVNFVVNWMLAGLFGTSGWGGVSTEVMGQAALCGLTFFIGQVFTFLALTRGDVSVATPVLGTKVIFVALFAVVLGVEPLTVAVCMGALLTTIATGLLGGTPGQGHRALAKSLLYGFTAAAAFALTDVLAQKWASKTGFGHFAPVMFLTVAVLSFGLVPFFNGRLRDLPWRWVFPGALLFALQSSGMAYSVMTFKSVTITNILYASRGVWSVLLVWSIGHWFANAERGHGRWVMIRRLTGSALLLLAIVLVAFR